MNRKNRGRKRAIVAQFMFMEGPEKKKKKKKKKTERRDKRDDLRCGALRREFGECRVLITILFARVDNLVQIERYQSNDADASCNERQRA